MKGYFITQKEMDRLRESVELSALRQKEFLNTHDERRHIIADVHRSMNFAVCEWISEVSK